jgi:hypothetical protein
MPRLTADFDREISITEKLAGLHREADRNLGAPVEHLKDMIANQTNSPLTPFLEINLIR